MKEAQEQIVEETRISPASSAPWIELSRLDLKLGKTPEALKAAQEAVRISPDNQDAHLLLAQAWATAGNEQKASAEKAFVAAPTDGQFRRRAAHDPAVCQSSDEG